MTVFWVAAPCSLTDVLEVLAASIIRAIEVLAASISSHMLLNVLSETIRFQLPVLSQLGLKLFSVVVNPASVVRL
jgi:hypothetical protein